MRVITTTFVVTAVIVFSLFAIGVSRANAEPSPPCGYYSSLPYSFCAKESPWQHYRPGFYDPSGEAPGKMGPWGYVPDTKFRR